MTTAVLVLAIVAPPYGVVKLMNPPSASYLCFIYFTPCILTPATDTLSFPIEAPTTIACSLTVISYVLPSSNAYLCLYSERPGHLSSCTQGDPSMPMMAACLQVLVLSHVYFLSDHEFKSRQMYESQPFEAILQFLSFN